MIEDQNVFFSAKKNCSQTKVGDVSLKFSLMLPSRFIKRDGYDEENIMYTTTGQACMIPLFTDEAVQLKYFLSQHFRACSNSKKTTSRDGPAGGAAVPCPGSCWGTSSCTGRNEGSCH